MGCSQSTQIETTELLSRCRDRKRLIKAAVSSRAAFAAAHTSYATALKNTGSALTDYALTAAAISDPSSDPTLLLSPPPSPRPRFRPPPPPPPPPNFPPLQRSVSMPDLPPSRPRPRRPKKPPAAGDIREEEEEEKEKEKEDGDPPPPPLPPPPREPPSPPRSPARGNSAWDFFFSEDPSSSLDGEEKRKEIRPEIRPEIPEKDVANAAPTEMEMSSKEQPKKLTKKSKQEGSNSSVHHNRSTLPAGASEVKSRKAENSVPTSTGGLNLTRMLMELDDHFLRAYESAVPMSKMLEAAHMHYHSNFLDNRGHVDHSARVMQVITWSKSSNKTPSNGNGRDGFNDEESETHATILDKLLAWEKKLYKEVKASELTRIDYDSKVKRLNMQKTRSVNSEAMEKIKAVVSHSRTKYMVDMQSLDSTVSEIRRLRDHQLYPKLTVLVEGMAEMWEAMHAEHDGQQKIIVDIQSLDVSSAPKETSLQLYDRTIQLHSTTSEWHSQFHKLVNHQKDYLQSLGSWLQLNVIPIKSIFNEGVSSPSPQGSEQPPIQFLLRAWHDHLEKLPEDRTKNALRGFAAVIDAIMVQQQEELKQKNIYESARNEYLRKEAKLGNWLDKQDNRRKSTKKAQQEGSESSNKKEEMTEKKLEVENLMKRTEAEKDTYLSLCKQVSEKTVASLKMHLPEVFRAMSDFSLACATMYKKLQAICTQNQTRAS